MNNFFCPSHRFFFVAGWTLCTMLAESICLLAWPSFPGFPCSLLSTLALAEVNLASSVAWTSRRTPCHWPPAVQVLPTRHGKGIIWHVARAQEERTGRPVAGDARGSGPVQRSIITEARRNRRRPGGNVQFRRGCCRTVDGVHAALLSVWLVRISNFLSKRERWTKAGLNNRVLKHSQSLGSRQLFFVFLERPSQTS